MNQGDGFIELRDKVTKNFCPIFVEIWQEFLVFIGNITKIEWG
jgi:hypothetical protein